MIQLSWLNDLPSTAKVYFNGTFDRSEFGDYLGINNVIVTWCSKEDIQKAKEKEGPIAAPFMQNDRYTVNMLGKNQYDIIFPSIPNQKPNPYLPIEDYIKNGFCTFDSFVEDTSGTRIYANNAQQDLSHKVASIYNTEWIKVKPILLLKFLQLVTHYDFGVFGTTLDILRKHSAKLKYIPIQQIGSILNLVMLGKYPNRFFDLLFQVGYAKQIIPHLYAAKKIEQSKKYGISNVAEHCILALSHVEEPNAAVRFAALYHDLGKATTKKEIDGRIRFYGHEKVGARWLYKDLKDWGFSEKFSLKSSHLVLHHMFDGGPQLSDDGVRRLIKRVGTDHIYDLISLRKADSAGFLGTPTGVWKMDKLKERVQAELVQNPFSAYGIALDRNQISTITGISKEEDITLVQDLMLSLILFRSLNNTESSLTSWLSQVNFSKIGKLCPLGLNWILTQQIDRIENTADENADGTLKCGKYCNYICDNAENVWKL